MSWVKRSRVATHALMSLAHPLTSLPLRRVRANAVLWIGDRYQGTVWLSKKYPSSSSINCSASSLSPSKGVGRLPVGLGSGGLAAGAAVAGAAGMGTG